MKREREVTRDRIHHTETSHLPFFERMNGRSRSHVEIVLRNGMILVEDVAPFIEETRALIGRLLLDQSGER